MAKVNPINVICIDHVVLRTADPEALIEFYRDVLGCRVERDLGELGLVQLRAGGSLVDIVDASGPIGRAGGRSPDMEAPNMDHFCLQVRPWDETAIRAQLEAHGIEVGEVAERYGALGPGPSLYVKDPAGNTVELKGAR